MNNATLKRIFSKESQKIGFLRKPRLSILFNFILSVKNQTIKTKKNQNYSFVFFHHSSHFWSYHPADLFLPDAPSGTALRRLPPPPSDPGSSVVDEPVRHPRQMAHLWTPQHHSASPRSHPTLTAT